MLLTENTSVGGKAHVAARAIRLIKKDTDIDKWDGRFLDLAKFISEWSKDPSTKVGAVLVRSDRTIAALGFNGFPRGVHDHPERYDDRPTKYEMVVHAEINALLSSHESLEGYTLYVTPLPPCTMRSGHYPARHSQSRNCHEQRPP